MDNLDRELERAAGTGVPPTVENVRRSCDEAAVLPDSPVRIDEQRLRSFSRFLDIRAVKRSSHLMAVPIAFGSVRAATNFHLNLHLFNFGHGYRHPLHALCGQGAWRTMKRGIEALHASCGEPGIDAAALAALTPSAVDALFGFPSGGAAGELDPLRDMILRVAHATGNRLIELGFPSFADMIADRAARGRLSAAGLVELLAGQFPAFDDRRSLGGGREVLFLKKAQIAVAELYQKLGGELADHVDFRDVTTFTVACDNVLPCVLKTLGILRLDPGLERDIAEGRPLPAGREEALLRAAALSAAEAVVRLSNGAFWAKELGDYLWTMGKDPGFRQAERHAARDTCFY